MSDNSRLMTMKIPCPLFWSWPSRHFHTNFYTADKLDPNVMKKCGMVTTYVALKIADAGRKEVLQFAQIIRHKTLSRMQQTANSGIKAIGDTVKNEQDKTATAYIDKLKYALERDITSLKTVKNLINNAHVEIEEEIQNIVEYLREVYNYENGASQLYKKYWSRNKCSQ